MKPNPTTATSLQGRLGVGGFHPPLPSKDPCGWGPMVWQAFGERSTDPGQALAGGCGSGVGAGSLVVLVAFLANVRRVCLDRGFALRGTGGGDAKSLRLLTYCKWLNVKQTVHILPQVRQVLTYIMFVVGTGGVNEFGK